MYYATWCSLLSTVILYVAIAHFKTRELRVLGTINSHTALIQISLFVVGGLLGFALLFLVHIYRSCLSCINVGKHITMLLYHHKRSSLFTL